MTPRGRVGDRTPHCHGAPYEDSEWALYDIRAAPIEIHDLAPGTPNW
ncbi:MULTISPECIES: hypothetical protein [Streptomyces]|nr:MULTISPECIES: hypothetical protein [unclassified Streptomyces]WSD93648.1 hypothetical protein OG758_05305 [Streptomyces sp. NBC_01474]